LLFISPLKATIDLGDVKAEITQLTQQLHQVNGNFIRGGVPKIIIKEQRGDGAAYNPVLHTLTLDLEVYNICQTFGDQSKDALAFIIGHEMAHCYMEHPFFSKFNSYHKCEGSTYSNEQKADVYGLFNAYLAGYNSFTILPEVIATIYKEYGLSDQLSGYPSKQDRMNTAIQSQKEIKNLIGIYESANYLSAIGKYRLAADSYEYILRFYQGREIYNNIAVNSALEGLNFTEKDYDLYLYPLEIDWNTRIKKPKKDRGGEDLTTNEMAYRMTCLSLAKENFEMAGRLDQSYFTSDINKIVVLTLMKRYKEAVDYYEQLEKSKKILVHGINEIQKESALLAVANAKAHLPAFNNEAREIFNALSMSENAQIAYQATYNLRVLEEGKCGAAEFISCQEPIAVPDYVDEIRLHRFKSNAEKIQLYHGIELLINPFHNSTVYQYHQNGSILFTFQQVNSESPAPKNILDESEKTKIVNTTNGYFIICETNRTVFYLTSDNQLKSWGKYY